MEVDSGTLGENRDRDGGGIHGSENVEVKIQNTPDSEPKVKRKMKTPTQLEILEKTYAVEAYPPEALRAELSVKLGLSDRQLQMWFCHRRLKDRKPPKEKQEKPEKRQKKVASSSAVEVRSGGRAPDIAAKNAVGSNHYNSGLSLFENVDLQNQHRVVHNVGVSVPRYEPPLAISEQRAIRSVEAQLGERLREDGPILGMEFDPLPHGAFGARIVPSEKKKPASRSFDAQLYEKLDAKPIQGASRALHEFQFLPEKPLARNDSYERFSPPHIYHSAIDASSARISFQSGASFSQCNEQLPSGFIISQMPIPKINGLVHQGKPAPGEVDTVLTVAPVVSTGFDSPHPINSVTGTDVQITTPEKHMVRESERSERKRKAEEARIVKEVESHEKKIRKELEKQNLLMKKREEQMRKEMERQIREQRKEEEKLMREKQREEERYQREQRREMERREKFLRKEYIRAEKRRLKEEVRREKEAAKLKAAHDRAAARRIAKESIELFDDERLELMELAGQTSNFPFALGSRDFDNLDSYKDKLMEFPPVPLKRPFQSQPWTDSEESVGDLLMVWRFLIAFADVLGLWPFTLDEFVQALHDFDSRLLGEIHIALLRSIINDIEEVARTSAAATSSMTANQTSAGIPPGGHPRIVEGAYAWGFDLLSWPCLLTPLTWPEVLRQFALSAGFGPKLKKSSAKSACFHDENEGDNGADNISSIRSGVAAENAFAIMQEKGFSKPRRSRHRLTPGTVKFAAFHVLSVAGSSGLSILEVAEKIQRSGLRDLKTSKTPEASISAALSRDTKLFERTAPSTYCVRSPYRKDPSDADAVLSAAREKVRLFMSGNTDDEVAEDVEKDAAERDADSESDIAEDPDDNVGKLTGSSHARETSLPEDSFQHATDNCSEQLSGSFTDATGCSSSRSTLKQSVDKITVNGGAVFQHIQNTVDECDSGEHWVRGLTEGEYGKLSVEERLRALVALVGIANEGNAVRIALEERLEAANALKKQMWAEAQLDKRRTKDDLLRLPCSTMASEREQSFVSEYGRSSQLRVDTKCDSQLANPRMQLIDLNDQQYDENFCSSRMEVKEESSLVSENLFEPSGYATERSRSDLKALIGHRAEGVYTYRSSPLGLDRRHNRYWQFVASPSCSDTGSGRIFVELSNGSWRLIDSEEAFYGLLSSLDVRGIRESHLHSMLRNIETSFRDSVRRGPSHFKSGIQIHHETGRNFLEGSSPSHTIATESRGTEVTDEMLKHKALESWMWKECFNCNVLSALKFGTLRRPWLLEICDSCYALVSPSFGWLCSCSYKGFDISGEDSQSKMENEEEFSAAFSPNLSLPPRIKLLKAQLSTIEASIPSESFDVCWLEDIRRSFALKLLMASTAEELLQSIAMLECSIKRDSFSPNFVPTSMLSSFKVGERSYTLDSSSSEAVPVLPWIPLTAAAVSLRLMEMDSAIYYTPEQKESRKTDNEAGFFSKYSSICSSLGIYINDATQDGGTFRQNGSSFDLANQGAGSRRGQGRPRGPSRTRGGKTNKLDRFPPPKGQQTVPARKGRGRWSQARSAANYYAEESEKQGIQFEDTEDLQDQPRLKETGARIEGTENAATSSGRSGSDDDNAQASADEYDEVKVGFSGSKPGEFEKVGEDRQPLENADDNDQDYDDDDDYYSRGYEEGNQDQHQEQTQKFQDDEAYSPDSSSSSDYSY